MIFIQCYFSRSRQKKITEKDKLPTLIEKVTFEKRLMCRPSKKFEEEEKQCGHIFQFFPYAVGPVTIWCCCRSHKFH